MKHRDVDLSHHAHEVDQWLNDVTVAVYFILILSSACNFLGNHPESIKSRLYVM